MRKIVVLNRISLDGAFAQADGGFGWFIPDPEIDKRAHELMSPDTVLLGRVTYQVFENTWPALAANPDAPAGARKHGEELNQMTKVVYSRTLDSVSWQNSVLMKGDIDKEVDELKRSDGGDIVIFGSGSIVRQLTDARLIDEYLMVVTPVVLGSGRPLFEGVATTGLTLVASEEFSTGNTLLHYRLPQS